jgi:hypothetical protein
MNKDRIKIKYIEKAKKKAKKLTIKNADDNDRAVFCVSSMVAFLARHPVHRSTVVTHCSLFTVEMHFTAQSAFTSIGSALLWKEIKQEAAREYLSTTIKTGNPLLEAIACSEASCNYGT